MGLYNARVRSALTDLKGAISANDGKAARKIVEDLARTDPEAAEKIVIELNDRGAQRATP